MIPPLRCQPHKHPSKITRWFPVVDDRTRLRDEKSRLRVTCVRCRPGRLIQMAPEDFGRPHRQTAAKEIPVVGPDTAIQREGKGYGENVARIPWYSPCRLIKVLLVA